MTTLAKIKKFPNSFEVEQAMLCCILIDPEATKDIMPTLDQEYFYNEQNKNIFTACKDLFLENINIDISTVMDKLRRNNNAELNSYDYIYTVISMVPSAVGFMDYFNILKRDKTLRGIINVCNQIIEEAYDSDDAEKVLTFASKLLYDLDTDVNKAKLRHISHPLRDLLSNLEEIARNKGKNRGLLTGMPIYDSVTNGLHPSDLIILAARPSVGKTSFALNIIANIAMANPDCVVAAFSLEMSDVQLVQRVLANTANVSMNNLSKGNQSDSENKFIWNVNKKLGKSKIFIDDTAMLSPTEILNKCRKLVRTERRLDLIVIDYLQLMRSDNRKSDGNQQQQIGEISRMMKLIAKELQCPVIVISQMSRGVENRDDKTPKLSDLRDSGAIEQDADQVLFLSRENENDKGSKEYNVILDISKHRNGELKAIRYKWEGPYIRFTETEDQYINREFVAEKKPKKFDH